MRACECMTVCELADCVCVCLCATMRGSNSWLYANGVHATRSRRYAWAFGYTCVWQAMYGTEYNRKKITACVTVL